MIDDPTQAAPSMMMIPPPPGSEQPLQHLHGVPLHQVNGTEQSVQVAASLKDAQEAFAQTMQQPNIANPPMSPHKRATPEGSPFDAWRQSEMEVRSRQAFASLMPTVDAATLMPDFRIRQPSVSLLTGTQLDDSLIASLETLFQSSPMPQPSSSTTDPYNQLSLEAFDTVKGPLMHANVDYIRVPDLPYQPWLANFYAPSTASESLVEPLIAQKTLALMNSTRRIPPASNGHHHTAEPLTMSGRDYLAQLDSTFLIPLSQQMAASFVPAPPEPKKRKRKAPKQQPDLQPDEAPVTSNDIAPPAEPLDITPDDAQVLNDETGTTKKKKRVRTAKGADVSGPFDFKGLLKKTVSHVDKLLQADDAAQDTMVTTEPTLADHSDIFDDQNRPRLSTLNTVLRNMKKLSDSLKLEELIEAFESESEGMSYRFLRLCETVFRSTDCVDLGISSSNSKIASSASPNKPNRNENEEPESTFDFDAEAFEQKLERSINEVFLGLEACMVSLMLIDGSRTVLDGSKKIYGEDLVSGLIIMVRNCLENVIYATAGLATAERVTLDDSGKFGILEKPAFKKQLSLVVDKICFVIKQFSALLIFEKFADSVVVMLYNVLIPAFYTEPSSIASTIGLEKLQLASITLLRTVFALMPHQRIPILEEVVGGLVKLSHGKRLPRQYKLADGKSIQMVTALVVHLVQSCCSASSLFEASTKAYLGLSELKASANKMDASEEDFEKVDDQELLENEAQFFNECKSGMEAVGSSAGFFLRYLISRCYPSNGAESASSRRKSMGTSSEAEHKVILESFLKDILLLLGEFDWPGAETIALIFSKLMIQALDEKKAGDTALKALALDWLGEISARLRSRKADILKLSKATNAQDDLKGLPLQLPKNELKADMGTGLLRNLWEVQSKVLQALPSDQSDDSTKNVKMYFIISWSALMSSSVSSGYADFPADLKQELQEMVLELCNAVSNESTLKSELPSRSASLLCLMMLHEREPLELASDVFLSRILNCLDSEAVTIRSRALKALSDIVHVDREVLAIGTVKRVVTERILDQSKSVRDAAIELLGTFLVTDPSGKLITEYYPVLIGRIVDVGASVRKRIIKLARDIYGVLFNILVNDTAHHQDNIKILSDICLRILERLNDEEDTVKDLALRSINEMWFSSFKTENGVHHRVPPTPVKHETASGPTHVHPFDALLNVMGPAETPYISLPVALRKEISMRAKIMSNVARMYNLHAWHLSNADAIGGLVKLILEGANGKANKYEAAVICRRIAECLIEQVLVCDEAGDKTQMTNIFCLMDQLARVFPALFKSHVKTLHPYLQPSVSSPQKQSQAQATDDRIAVAAVSILTYTVPYLHNADMQLMNSIETDLLATMTKRSLGVIAYAVPCLATLVLNVTKNYQKVTHALKTTFDLLTRSRDRLRSNQALSDNERRMVGRCMFIAALLVRYFDFDKERAKLTGPAAQDILPIAGSKNLILLSVYEAVIFFGTPAASKVNLQSMTLQSLRHLFMAHPTLMLRDDARELMTAVFEAGSVVHQFDLVKVIVEYLKSEQERAVKQESQKKQKVPENGKSLDIKVLVGNSEDMTDAGVSAIMQMYLSYIIKFTLGKEPQLSKISFEAICLILEQGLVHPIQCAPALVAMQTCPDPFISDRAVGLYELLAEKHQTFFHSKTFECVKKAYEYQNQLLSKVWVDGFKMVDDTTGEVARKVPVAMLSRFYSKIHTQKKRRNEFLSSMVRGFDINKDKISIPFGRFIVDNLALFEYKSSDEVLLVIYYITQVLSVTGETTQKHIEEMESGSTILKGDELKSLAVTSALMGFLIVLKDHLKRLYGLTDIKCRKFNPSETSANEKSRPAIRSSGVPLVIDWARKAIGEKEMVEEEDMRDQCRSFMELMSVEYLSYEKEEEAMMEEAAAEEENVKDEQEGGDTSQNDSVDTPTVPATKTKTPGGKKRGGGKTKAAQSLERTSAKANNKRRKSATLSATEETVPHASPIRSKRKKSAVVSIVESEEDDETSVESEPMWE
ncbi:Sister chromatid cohesion protein 2 [Chytridiales sp. JEL 0842]|nr:Sister chromatid cohesion protein 2 [Chytridiales sp. JEL 0842]